MWHLFRLPKVVAYHFYEWLLGSGSFLAVFVSINGYWVAAVFGHFRFHKRLPKVVAYCFG
jgi:hypothetical protein